MAQGDFVLVVPPGWIELADADALIAGWGEEGLRQLLAEEQWGQIDGMIDGAGLLPPGQTLTRARMIETGNDNGGQRLRFWCQFAPLPV